MSGNVAVLAGGVAGAFIGSFFGMPGLGFSIGSGLAGMAFAPKPKGTSVDPGDLSFDTSAYGKFQPWGYGTYLVQGPVTFWSTDYVAHKHTEKVGGKGGGAGKQKVETITYTRSFAVYLADCTNAIPIIGVRRIWDAISGQMLYDVGSEADAETIIASQQMAKAVRVYTGALDQQPDPLIEAHEGWSPAWRGHAYVVFEDWDHGGAKQAPVLAIEVVAGGAVSAARFVNAWSPAATNKQILQDYNDGILTFGYMPSNAGSGSDYEQWRYDLLGNRIAYEKTDITDQYINDAGEGGCVIINNGASDPPRWIARKSGVAYAVDSNGGKYAPGAEGTIEAGYTWFNNTLFLSWCVATGTDLYMVWHEAGHFSRGRLIARYRKPHVSTPAIPQSVYRYNAISEGVKEHLAFDEEANLLYVWNSFADTLVAHDADSLAPIDSWTFPSDAIATPEHMQFDVRAGILTTVGISGIVANNSIPVATYLLPVGGGEASLIEETTTPGLDGVLYQSARFIDEQVIATNLGIWTPEPGLNAGAQNLSSVLADLCQRAGLALSDYDTSLLLSTPVRLNIDRLRPARDWMTELGNIYRFRLRNSGGPLQFVPKGSSSVATIGQVDLGLDVSEGNRPPITASRTQGIDLPRSVTVVYSDADNDYAPGQQYYVMRQYPQGQDIQLTVTAILTGAEALELAQIAAKEPHLERLSWTTSVGIKHLNLEAGDVVDLPTGRSWVRDIQEQGDSVLRATFVAEASSAYSGNGLPAPAAPAAARKIRLSGPTRMELLDVPILQDADDGPGVYLAAAGYLSGWSGAEVYRSDDGEVFDPLASVITAAVIGTTTNALVLGPVNIWDRANTLNVNLIAGTLASASELNVLNGANAAAVGAHGRWEIIQFETAILETDGSYTLSKLSRGRKGTEWAVGTHQAGDTFVSLTNNTLGRVDKSLNDIGATRQYKAVSFGNDITAATAIEFANQGVGLKPYAPSHVSGSRNGSGDLTVKWIRRTRIGGEWRDYVDASLGEDSESYEVDIMNGSTVVRTIAAASTTATYTAADQTTDFGSTQSSITLRIYQLSADIGRGYSTEATL